MEEIERLEKQYNNFIKKEWEAAYFKTLPDYVQKLLKLKNQLEEDYKRYKKHAKSQAKKIELESKKELYKNKNQDKTDKKNDIKNDEV